MSTSKLKVGIIGTGFGASVHAPLFQAHPQFEVIAITSVSGRNTEQVRKATGISNIYSDWKTMLTSEALDLVSVTSAQYQHKEMVCDAFAHGYHVLCEKPMALNLNEAQEMIAARDHANRFGAINFEFRYLPARSKVKEIIESGQLGRIIHIRYQGNALNYLSHHSGYKSWKEDKALGGGTLNSIGSHMIDSIQWWFQEPIASVFGQTPIHSPERLY
ncbi:Gfo/Idh/MocA family protein [Brevibacillus sp. VP]|uniref:Gfo/Idh/MocA family protein n=1 Tax=unclassified Brevibacillus TaxID=2684853 RepID=UPI000E2EACB5|nr:Gfo/Idh/MocA family oxidoreductase [Brevibacillus sp. VP]RFB38340.1 gfo/Idh/MocA family oxidoreductase [Brevibacillus sp. VP]